MLIAGRILELSFRMSIHRLCEITHYRLGVVQGAKATDQGEVRSLSQGSGNGLGKRRTWAAEWLQFGSYLDTRVAFWSVLYQLGTIQSHLESDSKLRNASLRLGNRQVCDLFLINA
ncbi:mCG1027473 [Mus musculus]|jgi:hypothetical protein|nr:mCG1027473 [Mus musculus]